MGLMTKGRTKIKRRVEPVDAANRVTARMFCIKCGTELRGRSIDAQCPICRHPIYDSVYGAYLIDASPLEPRQLYERSKLVYYPALFVASLTAILLLVSVVAAPDFVRAVELVFENGFFCAMLCPLVALVGIVMFTGRHSVPYYRAKYGNPRFITVAGIVLIVVGAAMVGAIAQFGQAAQDVIRTAFATVPVAIFLQRLGRLMRRAPNKKLASLSNLACGLTVVLGAASLAILLMQPHAKSSRQLAGLLIALTCVVDIGGIALGIAALRLIVLARRTLLAIRH